MKTLALVAALAASVAAPAFAQSAQEIAVANYNASVDSFGDLILVNASPLTDGTTVSSRNSSALGAAIANYNASADMASDRIDGRFVTTFARTPAHAADIFAQLAAESREDN